MKQDSDSAPVLSGWRVSKIEVVEQGEAVEIEFTVNGRSPFRFRSQEFGVGGRDARTAALARFAARAGYGDVKTVFKYLSLERSTDEGNVFPLGPLGRNDDHLGPWSSANLYPEYEYNSESVDVYPA